jgi:hypothetical protein
MKGRRIQKKDENMLPSQMVKTPVIVIIASTMRQPAGRRILGRS